MKKYTMRMKHSMAMQDGDGLFGVGDRATGKILKDRLTKAQAEEFMLAHHIAKEHNLLGLSASQKAHAVYNAVNVALKDPAISKFLHAHDPKAMGQLQDAWALLTMANKG